MRHLSWAILACWGLLLFWQAPAAGQAPESHRLIKKTLIEARKKKPLSPPRTLETIISITDNFNDGAINPSIWVVDNGSPLEQGGVLSLNATSPTLVVTLSLASPIPLAAEDMFLTIDFTSFTSTGSSEAGIFIYADTFSAQLTLTEDGGRRAVFYAENDDGSQSVHYHLPTTATTGSLRLVYHRNAGVLESLLKEGETWTRVGDTVGVNLGVFSTVNAALFAFATENNAASANFDNFLLQTFSADPVTAVRRKLWTLYDK